jgi:hypothetical protein
MAIADRFLPGRTALAGRSGDRGDDLVMPAQRELGARVEFAETVLQEARKIGPQQCLVLARTMGSAAVIALPECGKMFSNLEHRHSGRIPAKATRKRGPEPAPWIPAFAQGCPGNGNGLLCLDRNQLKVVMRGLGSRIHAVAGGASVCCEHWMAGSSLIKSGHDDSKLYKDHCAFGSVPMANSADGPALSRG